METTKSSENEVQGDWLGLSLSSEALGEKAKWRVRTDVDDCRNAFPVVVLITWPSEGFPGMDLRAQFMAFERDIANLSFGANSRLVATLMSGNGKTWLFHCPRGEEFVSILNETLRGQQALPLRIQSRRDPEWTEYGELRSFVEKRVRNAASPPG